MAKNQLTPKTEDMSKWYVQVIQQSQLADYSPVKGCMVIRPNGYEIWENIHDALDPMFKDLGIRNSYFPTFIPMSLLNKEVQHVEGFAPELAVVTHGGGEELQEKLAVRPTSETIMYAMYSKWVQSYRDLPLLLNQWNNAVRWEKRTYFFLRTTEFLWQEAHTAHSTHAESWEMVLKALESYRSLVEDYLAIPVVKGRKSLNETFAGASLTTTIEAMMPDGKALQAGTSHDLGQNFSKKDAFNIAFQDEKGETDYAWQTSFGLSTRIIGALIMTHGDDDGLILPPRIASNQVAIIPVEDTEQIQQASLKILDELKKNGVRTVVMFNKEHRFGRRLNEAEMQGIPLTLVVGQQEIDKGLITAKVRYSREEKMIQFDKATDQVITLLSEIQVGMLNKAIENRNNLMTEVDDYKEFQEVMLNKRGYLKAFWCEDKKCEAEIKEETKATTRCLPFSDDIGNVLEEKGLCIKCGNAAVHRWLFAQAY